MFTFCVLLHVTEARTGIVEVEVCPGVTITSELNYSEWEEVKSPLLA